MALATVAGNGDCRQMSISDGAILFAACALSFALGFAIGAFRVTSFVSKELKKLNVHLDDQTHELKQFTSRLSEDDNRK